MPALLDELPVERGRPGRQRRAEATLLHDPYGDGDLRESLVGTPPHEQFPENHAEREHVGRLGVLYTFSGRELALWRLHALCLWTRALQASFFSLSVSNQYWK